jgi:hypothetical protein
MEGMLLQSDGKLLIFGSFSTYNGAPRSYVARVFTRNSPAEPPLIESRFLPTGLLELRWPDVPGFALESVNNFGQQWLPVSNVPPAVGGIHTLTVPADGPIRFFRLKQ